MKVWKYILIAVGAFLVIVVFAAGVTARFSISNITADTYGFIEKFFSQWSPALGAASTVILVVTVLWTIYNHHRGEERVKEQVIHALHDEIHSNLTDVIQLRFRISEKLRKEADTSLVLTEYQPFQAIDTAVFESMKNGGQLHWLRDMRMHTIFCYKLIKQYNRDEDFQYYHLELLANMYDALTKAITDLEANFNFLPPYLKGGSEFT